MLTTCKLCQQPKQRIPNGTSPNGKRKYYVDENNESWMGRKCPDCYRDQNKERMRRNRKFKTAVKNVANNHSKTLKKLAD